MEGAGYGKQAEPTFLTPRDAAKLLNVPTHRILNMIQCKALPALPERCEPDSMEAGH
jgi:hypothetical protein